MLLNANLTIYRSEICDLLLTHSNTLEDVSLTTIKQTVCKRLFDGKLLTQKKVIQSNENWWTHPNMVYTQQYFDTVSGFSVDDILFMDESSVHINCCVRKYHSAQKGQIAVRFLKH